MSTRRRRTRDSQQGQVGVEYVGLAVLVAAVIVTLVALGMPARIGHAIERAVCRISQEQCPPWQQRTGPADHPPRTVDGKPERSAMRDRDREIVRSRPHARPIGPTNSSSSSGNGNGSTYVDPDIPEIDAHGGPLPDRFERLLGDPDHTRAPSWKLIRKVLGMMDFLPYLDEVAVYYPVIFYNIDTWFEKTNSPKADAVGLSLMYSLLNDETQKNVKVVKCATQDGVQVLCVHNAEQVIPANARAFTMGHVIFCSDTCTDTVDSCKPTSVKCGKPPAKCMKPLDGKDCRGTVLAHELVHVKQYQQMGSDRFWVEYYMINLPLYGQGCSNPLERPAYRLNHNCKGKWDGGITGLVEDTAEWLGDTVTDVLEEVNDFWSDLWGGDDSTDTPTPTYTGPPRHPPTSPAPSTSTDTGPPRHPPTGP